MIVWVQHSGPVHWRSQDRRFSVAEVQTADGMRYRAIHARNMAVDWSGSLCLTPEASKAEADAEDAKRQAVAA